MTYSDKLKDPRWQELRLEIIARDGHKCVICDETQNLHVHHGYYTSYFKNPWEYEDITLHTLCATCHDRVHDAIDEIQRNIGIMHPSIVESPEFRTFICRHKFEVKHLYSGAKNNRELIQGITDRLEAKRKS